VVLVRDAREGAASGGPVETGEATWPR
jgi:hypothetical protein